MTTELYIENTRVDLTDDVVIPITFWLSTIKDISKRTSSYSKTVRIPGTKRNNELFAHAYDLQMTSQSPDNLNIGSNFNRKKLSDFTLLSNGSNVLSGTAELKRVVQRDGIVTYEVILYGELINLVNSVADNELRDLDTTELDHEFTIASISGSWDYNEPYVYPLIDYGVVNTRMESVTMENFRPAVKASWYWDKIFEEANFEYTGSFFGTDRWNKLIVPYNKEEVPESTIFDEIQIQTQNQDTTLSTNTVLYQTGVNDPDGAWDSGSQTLTAPITGSYNFNSALQLVMVGSVDGVNVNNNDLIENREFDVEVDLEVNGTVVQTVVQTIDQGEVYSERAAADNDPVTWSPRSVVAFTVFMSEPLDEGDQVRFIYRDTRINANPFVNVTQSTQIGDFLNIILRKQQIMTIAPSSIEGSVVDGSTIVPTSVKQKDFVTGILKVFNLYAEPDDDQPRKLNIKTRDSYYDTKVFRDWTQKVDHSKAITNETLEDTDVRTLQLKWKSDEDDYFQNQYRRRWGRDYGERRIDTGYEFNNEIKDVLELPFSTSIPIQYSQGVLVGDTRIEVTVDNQDIVRVVGLTELLEEDPTETEPDLPQFERALIGRQILIGEQELTIVDLISPWEFQVNANVDTFGQGVRSNYRVYNQVFTYIGSPIKVVPAILESEDRGVTRKPFDSELRLMYYNGTIPSNGWTIMQTPRKPESAVKYFYNSSFPKSQSFNVYPFSSHVLGNGPTDFNFDLLFSQPEQIYWSLEGATLQPEQPTVSTNSATDVNDDYFRASLELGNVSGFGYNVEWGFQYRIQGSTTWSETSTSTSTSNGTKNKYITGLQDDTIYEFRGFANRVEQPNNRIYGGTQTVQTAISPLATPPSMNLFYSESTCEVQVGWTGVSGATRYRLERRIENESIWTFRYENTATGFIDDVQNIPNFGGDLTIYYRVRAENDTAQPDSDWKEDTIVLVNYGSSACSGGV